MNLPCDGETITVTLYWSGGSASYTLTAVNQPEYQDSSLYHRDDCPRWYQCDRCGFLYPMDEVTREPLSGLRVCYRFCYDEATWGDDVLAVGMSSPIYQERD
jgi:hypothetical protein